MRQLLWGGGIASLLIIAGAAATAASWRKCPPFKPTEPEPVIFQYPDAQTDSLEEQWNHEVESYLSKWRIWKYLEWVKKHKNACSLNQVLKYMPKNMNFYVRESKPTLVEKILASGSADEADAIIRKYKKDIDDDLLFDLQVTATQLNKDENEVVDMIKKALK